MKHIVCDRCGDAFEFTEKDGGTITMNQKVYAEHASWTRPLTYDLCPKCMSDFDVFFMTGRPLRRR